MSASRRMLEHLITWQLASPRVIWVFCDLALDITCHYSCVLTAHTDQPWWCWSVSSRWWDSSGAGSEAGHDQYQPPPSPLLRASASVRQYNSSHGPQPRAVWDREGAEWVPSSECRCLCWFKAMGQSKSISLKVMNKKERLTKEEMNYTRVFEELGFFVKFPKFPPVFPPLEHWKDV